MILGKQAPAAPDSGTLICQVPDGKQAAITLSVVNIDAAALPTDFSIYLANAVDLRVMSVPVLSYGSGYTQIPNLVFSGGNPEFPATASVNTIRVSNYTVFNRGTGYKTGDTIQFANTTGECVTGFTVLTVDAQGAVLTTTAAVTSTPGIKIHGNNRSATTFTTGAGTGFSVSDIRYQINSATLTYRGGGYQSTPTLTAQPLDGNGSGAAFTVNMGPDILYAWDLMYSKVTLAVGDTFERSGIALGSGDKLYIATSRPNTVSAMAFGLVEDQ